MIVCARTPNPEKWRQEVQCNLQLSYLVILRLSWTSVFSLSPSLSLPLSLSLSLSLPFSLQVAIEGDIINLAFWFQVRSNKTQFGQYLPSG